MARLDEAVKKQFSRKGAKNAKKNIYNINQLSLRSLPFDFAQGREPVERRLCERFGLFTGLSRLDETVKSDF
ncbi:MAG: hypothetical protein ABIL58_24030 [Pseudomonadota bacterium]